MMDGITVIPLFSHRYKESFPLIETFPIVHLSVQLGSTSDFLQGSS